MSYHTLLLTSHLTFEFTTLFCTIDDFFQKNEAVYWQYLKQENPKVRQRSSVLCLSEIIFIAVWYKNSQIYHVKVFAARYQTRIFYLPAYSPDLNPIEKAWSVLKSKVRHMVAQNNKTFSEALDIAFTVM